MNIAGNAYHLNHYKTLGTYLKKVDTENCGRMKYCLAFTPYSIATEKHAEFNEALRNVR